MTTVNTTWVTQKTWAAGDALTASDFNTYIRNQQNALKTTAKFYVVIDEAADYTISTATSFADIDSTDLAATFTTGGGTVFVTFSGTISSGGTTEVYFELLVDGVVFGGADGICTEHIISGERRTVTFTVPVTGLASGSHTIKIQWKLSAGTTVTLYASAGTATHDVRLQFFGNESG